MASFSKKEREYYNQHRERVGKELGIDKNKYNAFRRAAAGLSEADTSYANGRDRMGQSFGDKEYHTKSVEHLKKIGSMAKKMGLHMHHQGDPRGASLYLAKKRINKYRYPQEGHVIY